MSYVPDIFELRLRIPFIEIGIGLLIRCEYAREFHYLAVHIRIYKWAFDFDLGLTDRRRKQK